MKIVTIIGARPQFIKAAAVSRVINKTEGIQEIIVHTGQHFDPNMSDIFFREMDIPQPNYRLEINSLSHGAMTGRMMESVEQVLQSEKPELVLVYGDTNSTLAGALTARKLNIRLAHVEAGLRSYNMSMPEEINRILTDRISDILFCPTTNAVSNLKKEGFDNYSCSIEQVGDVMYDAALYYSKISGISSYIINKLGLSENQYILCTVHRQENTDNLNNLSSIITELNRISKNIRVVLPLHPRSKKILDKNNIKLDFQPIEPVGYFDIIELLRHTGLVITDSGGMQKEAFFFGKYCLTLREETEWTELVDHQYNQLVGCNDIRIKEGIDAFFGRKINNPVSLYGKGNASERIVQYLRN
jgi:UDP-GlcNAc3NAcA epimerase